MTKRRDYPFTVNNETQLDCEQILALNYKYLVIGIETCPTTLTPHLQCYVYLHNAITAKSLSKKIPRAHIEYPRKSPQKNADYCKKDGLYYEYGKFPQAGFRSDLHSIMERIDEGATEEEIRKEFPSQYLMYRNRINELIPNVIQKKTRKVFRLRTCDTYKIPGALFCDEIPSNYYNGQKVVITTSLCSFSTEKVQQWLHGFPPYFKFGYTNKLFDPDYILFAGKYSSDFFPDIEYICLKDGLVDGDTIIEDVDQQDSRRLEKWLETTPKAQ